MAEPIKYRQLIDVIEIVADLLDNDTLMVTCLCEGDRDYSFHLPREMGERLRQDIAFAFRQESKPSFPA